MSKKTKGILKFLLTIGIILSAAAAVFAIITRMQKKLSAVDEPSDTEDGAVCNGSCSDCTICDTEEDDDTVDVEE